MLFPRIIRSVTRALGLGALTAVAVLSSVAVGSTATAAPAATSSFELTNPNGTYLLGASSQPLSKLQQFFGIAAFMPLPLPNDGTTLWKLTNRSNGTFTLRNIQNDQCLDYDPQWDIFATMPCQSSLDRQRFVGTVFDPIRPRLSHVRTVVNSRYLTAQSGGFFDSPGEALLIPGDFTGASNQRIHFARVVE